MEMMVLSLCVSFLRWRKKIDDKIIYALAMFHVTLLFFLLLFLVLDKTMRSDIKIEYF